MATSKKAIPKKQTAKKETAKKTVSKNTTPKKATAPKKETAPKKATKPTKATTKKTASNGPKQNATKKPTDNRAKVQGVILHKSGLDKNGNQKLTAINVYNKTPKGWKETNGATTAPKGYKWIDNGKSHFGGKRKIAFVKDGK